MSKHCAHCRKRIPLARVTCGSPVCVKKQMRLSNAHNHKERWSARIALGLCGRCGAKRQTPGNVTCASCRAVVNARNAAKAADAMRAREQAQTLLAQAERRAHSADQQAKRREAGLPVSYSKTPRVPRGATPPAEV